MATFAPSDFWNKRYSNSEYAYGTAPNDFLTKVVTRIPRGPVLCLAEGEGRNAVFLAAKGYDVTAVDISSVGLEKAQALAADRGVTLRTVQADLSEFVIEPGAWSGIISIWAHVPPDVRRDLHQRVVEGLAPGGALVLEAYTPDQIALGTGGPPDARMMMTAAGLRDELRELRIDSVREIRRSVHEGVWHNGPSAVVQLLAFR